MPLGVHGIPQHSRQGDLHSCKGPPLLQPPAASLQHFPHRDPTVPRMSRLVAMRLRAAHSAFRPAGRLGHRHPPILPRQEWLRVRHLAQGARGLMGRRAWRGRRLVSRAVQMGTLASTPPCPNVQVHYQDP